MSVYLKKASKATTTDQEKIRATVEEILDSIRGRGETAVREFAAKFDNWTRNFLLSEVASPRSRIIGMERLRRGDPLPRSQRDG